MEEKKPRGRPKAVERVENYTIGMPPSEEVLWREKAKLHKMSKNKLARNAIKKY